jgi:hypothetical protein
MRFALVDFDWSRNDYPRSDRRRIPAPSRKILFEISSDFRRVALAELPEPAKDKAVVQREELQADEAGSGKTSRRMICEMRVAWPGGVSGSRDHGQDGVAGSVERRG